MMRRLSLVRNVCRPDVNDALLATWRKYPSSWWFWDVRPRQGHRQLHGGPVGRAEQRGRRWHRVAVADAERHDVRRRADEPVRVDGQDAAQEGALVAPRRGPLGGALRAGLPRPCAHGEIGVRRLLQDVADRSGDGAPRPRDRLEGAELGRLERRADRRRAWHTGAGTRHDDPAHRGPRALLEFAADGLNAPEVRTCGDAADRVVCVGRPVEQDAVPLDDGAEGRCRAELPVVSPRAGPGTTRSSAGSSR